MITYIETLNPEDFANLPNGSMKTRILALFSGYGAGFDFLDFWLQKETDKITAAICRFEGAAWLVATEDANWEELSAFLKVISPEVFLEFETAKRLGITPQEKFFEVKKETLVQDNNIPTPPIMQIYDMLMSGADGDIEITNKNEWYADISYRFRHGMAKAVATEKAVALAGFVFGDSAVVTGVATEPNSKHRGEGKAVLDLLCKALHTSTIYAEATDRAIGFYLKCGFLQSATLVRCKT